MEKKMIKAFEEKKKNAEHLRNLFGICAVLYFGFIVLLVCAQKYNILFMTFNVWGLLVYLAVENQSEKIDAELVLKYIEYVEKRNELIKLSATLQEYEQADTQGN